MKINPGEKDAEMIESWKGNKEGTFAELEFVLFLQKIVRTLVEAHGGKVWAENSREGGAIFHVEFPLAKQLAPEMTDTR